jgi:stage II sporulation protein D
MHHTEHNIFNNTFPDEEKIMQNRFFAAFFTFVFTMPLMASCVSMNSSLPSGRVEVKSGVTARTATSEKKETTWKEDDYKNDGDDRILVINVLLLKTGEAVHLRSKDGLRCGGDDELGKSCEIKSDGASFIAGGRSYDRPDILITSNGIIEFGTKKYRGSFVLYREGGKMLIVNRLSIEEYLYGVLPSEISPSWHMEALKAQAVAARSFAFYNKLAAKDKRYDLESSVNSQVYNGFGVEAETTNNAVNATRGLVMSYDGAVVQAFFHANSGGMTEDSREVWGGSLPYLKCVDDPFCSEGKHYKWDYTVTLSKLSDNLSRNGISVGEIYDIKVLERDDSGRVTQLKFYGSGGTHIIKGKDLRTYAGVDSIRSSNFEVRIDSADALFNGLGWGHGVGLSQEGAQGMAKKGYLFKDILKYYYKGVSIKKAVLK